MMSCLCKVRNNQTWVHVSIIRSLSLTWSLKISMTVSVLWFSTCSIIDLSNSNNKTQQIILMTLWRNQLVNEDRMLTCSNAWAGHTYQSLSAWALSNNKSKYLSRSCLVVIPNRVAMYLAYYFHTWFRIIWYCIWVVLGFFFSINIIFFSFW